MQYPTACTCFALADFPGHFDGFQAALKHVILKRYVAHLRGRILPACYEHRKALIEQMGHEAFFFGQIENVVLVYPRLNENDRDGESGLGPWRVLDEFH